MIHLKLMACNDPVESLSGLAQKSKARFKKLSIETVSDLLHYFPIDYQDRRAVAMIDDVKAGDFVTVKVRIELMQAKRSFRRRTTVSEAMVADKSGTIRVVWFGNRFIQKTLKAGDEVYMSGKVYEDQFGLQLRSPEHEKVKERSIHANSIVARYALTKGMTHKSMRFFVSKALEKCRPEEWLPEIVTSRGGLMKISDALRAIHAPKTWKQLRMAQKRLKFDELFMLQLRASVTRSELIALQAPVLDIDEKSLQKFVKNLPYTLTDDQKKAAWAILLDMKKGHPMNRMLQGDVGSGKTVVAALVMYHMALQGHVSMLMAPTEILAQQHYETFCELFADFDVGIGLYSRSMRRVNGTDEALTKKQFANILGHGGLKILIGTHALLHDPLKIDGLGMVVVDEQHRFGVAQRRSIKDRMKGDLMPHFLSMTATPIPRSASLVLYGELDISIIREKPKGRKPIQTKLVSEIDREKVYGLIHNQLDRDRQVFVVCPMIDESDTMDVANVSSVFERLSKGVFSDRVVEMLHGKMKPKQKEDIMTRMASGEIDVLVATSVIEVGVDVPGATVMMIEGAERFGLAQLHQFRGRIGRSSHQSYCYVFVSKESDEANGRLRIFEKHDDGFVLAKHDLEMRGPGDMYGTMQSGFADLKLASLRDVGLIDLAKREAIKLCETDEDKSRCPEMWARLDVLRRRVHME